MKFADFNIGYVFGYNSRITDEGIFSNIFWVKLCIYFLVIRKLSG